MANGPRVESFLAYYSDGPGSSPPRQQRPPQQMSQQQQRPMNEKGYAFTQGNAIRQGGPNIRAPQPAYRPPQPQPVRSEKPVLPNIQVSRAPAPPQAAFVASPHYAAFNGGVRSPGSLSPQSPVNMPRKASAGSETNDDRFAGSVVGSQNGHMDFWKRFSMVMHDAEMEEKGLKKTNNNTWLKKQIEGRRKYKLAIWCVAIVILIIIGASLGYHFTHESKGDSQPSTHDFGLSPQTSANPLATLSLNAGPSRRTAIPLALSKEKKDRMHRRRRIEQAAKAIS